MDTSRYALPRFILTAWRVVHTLFATRFTLLGAMLGAMLVAVLITTMLPMSSSRLAAVEAPTTASSPDTALTRTRIAQGLIDGIGELAYEGIPDAMALYGPGTLPLLRDGQGRDTAALLYDGTRAALVLGHDAWFKASAWSNPEMARLLDRMLRWWLEQAVDRALRRGLTQVQVLLFRTRDLGRRLRPLAEELATDRGLRISIDEPRRFPADLSGYAGIACYLPVEPDADFEADSPEAMRQALDAGTPVIAAGIGWVYNSYGQGRSGHDISRYFSGNRVFAPYGIAFTGYQAQARSSPVLPSPDEPRLARLAQQSARAFVSAPGPSQDDSSSLWTQAMPILDWSLALGPDLLEQVLEQARRMGNQLVPTAALPVARSNYRLTTGIALVELISRRHPHLLPWLYPLVAEFPGRMTRPGPSGSPGQTTSHERTVTLVGQRWQGLALWVNAGDRIRVRYKGPAQGDSSGGWLQVGAHSDNLFTSSRNQWERWPVLTESWSIDGAWQDIQVRYSGPLYWRWARLPEASSQASSSSSPAPQALAVEVQGARPMPVWRPGDDAAAFMAEVARSDCPFVEVYGSQVAFTQARDSLPADFDPQRIMAFWDRAALLVADLVGREPKPGLQRFVTDRQTSSGYMHSGYPVMSHLDVGNYQMGGNRGDGQVADMRHPNVLTSGAWGHFHELGHNYNDARWTFNRGSEVTVNLFTLYLMQELTGKAPLDHDHLRDNAAATRQYLANPVWSRWSDNPFVALGMYAVPAAAFGWEPYRQTFRAYGGLSEADTPRTDQARIDTWVRLYSRAVGRNLVPWFRRWACPVSPEVERSLADLPSWVGPATW